MTLKYGIRAGDIFVAADKGKYGHVVTDADTYAACGDVVTVPFTENGLLLSEEGNRIDAFKLACVRYYRPDETPNWLPDSVVKYSEAILLRKPA